MHSSPFSRRVAPCAPLLSSLTKDRKERDGDNADGEAATGRCAAGWQGARQAYMTNQPRQTAATPDLPTTIPTPPLPACSSSCIPDCIRPQIAAHALQIVTHIVSQHLNTHPTLSTQPGVISPVSVLLALIALPIASEVTRVSSYVFCLGFVLELLLLARFCS